MKFKFHNKIDVYYKGKHDTFFNTLFNNVFTVLKNKTCYNRYAAIGSGLPSNAQNSYHLTKCNGIVELDSLAIQNDISLGTPFVKKALILNDSTFDGMYITELGLTADSASDNPTLINYISLVNETYPNGILKVKDTPILIFIFIYLDIASSDINCLTLGDNKFISYLLGEGLSENLYAIKANNNSSNISSIYRGNPESNEKFPCSFSVLETEHESGDIELKIQIESNLGSGETREIVFLIDNNPFARINVLDYKNSIDFVSTITPKESLILDLGEDVKHIDSITNNSNNSIENNWHLKRYASSFGDKIAIPFYNMMNHQTPRFVSKDGDKIFFVVNDYVYGYMNEDYQLKKINMGNINIQNISNIISFENYVFVVSKVEPVISAFIIDNYNLIKCNFEPSDPILLNTLSYIQSIDITIGKNNVFLIGIISAENHNGFTFYFSFDQSTNSFIYNSHIESDHKFSYVLAMYKNNFTDSFIMYLEEGDTSYNCRLVTHYPDKESEDVYTSLAYYYTKDTKKIHIKGRAVIVEKNTSPTFWIYFYPQMTRYMLPLLSNEKADYISTNLLYLIQKLEGNIYKIYNLVGYDTPVEFATGFPAHVDLSKVEDFEFLNDILLIFTNNPNEPVIGFNLNDSGTIIENISSTESTYNVSGKKYNIVGKNNESVIAKFTSKVHI